MNEVISVLTKTFAREFYRLNSGFFLLIGTLAFGFMSDVEHIALAQFFITATHTTLIPVCIWIIYTFKVLNFNSQQLYRVENSTIFNAAFLSPLEKVLSCGIFLALQLLPAHCYGIFLIVIASKSDVYQNIPILILTLVGCTAAGTVAMMRNLRKPFRKRNTSRRHKFFDHHFHKPLLRFYIEWILRRDPLMIAGTKILSAALVFGVCALYDNMNYDWRLLSMTITACAIAHLLVLFQLQDFEHGQISWVKNLPLTLARRYLTLCMVISVLLLPEGVILWRYFPPSLTGYWTILTMCYFLSLACLLLGILQTRAWSLERFTKASFWIFILFTLLILFKTPIILLVILNSTAGYLMFSAYYYSFEPHRPAQASR